MTLTTKIIIAVAVIVAVAIGGLWYTGYFARISTEEKAESDHNTITPEDGQTTPASDKSTTPKVINQAQAEPFAEFVEPVVTVTPAVANYSVDGSLSTVTNAAATLGHLFTDAPQSAEVKAHLADDLFVVLPGYNKEFHTTYESNRYDTIPSFVTTDSVLHAYHLFFDYALRTIEGEQLVVKLKSMNAALLTAAESQYQSLQGTAFETAAKRNVAFISVAGKLLDDSVVVPEHVSAVVTEELELIAAQQGPGSEPDPIIGMGQEQFFLENPSYIYTEDFSQYIPRGHYTKSEDLQKYFKAMMWYGRMTYRQISPEETCSALLMTKLIAETDDAETPWAVIYDVSNFFVGKSDDLGYRDYLPVAQSSFGNELSLESFSDETKYAEYIEGIKALEPPQINSIVVTQGSDRDAIIKGFRLMGQRFTLDASIFQRLVCREVGNKHGTMDCPDPTDWEPRMTPKGLDIPAAMGSDTAKQLLTEQGDMEYKNYPENLQKMREYVAGLDQATWTQNLYWSWLYGLKPVTEARGAGYPSFMQSDAWLKKQLVAYLGSWTELKHDTILYAKQVYAELGGAGPEEQDDRGYVEPEYTVYNRLAALTRMTKEGLQLRGLLPSDLSDVSDRLITLCEQLRDISVKELQNQALTDDEYEFIRAYGGSLEHIWDETLDSAERSKEDSEKLESNPAPLVADVATNPGGTVLEEGTGYINTIYVVVPVAGELRLAKGSVYSQYEFLQPMTERLTDEAWREMLQSNPPELESWKESYMVE